MPRYNILSLICIPNMTTSLHGCEEILDEKFKGAGGRTDRGMEGRTDGQM